MPSATEVDFDVYLRTQARDFIPDLVDVLRQLDPSFPELSLDERYEHVSQFSGRNPGEFAKLLARVYDCYYQDDRVREKIGVVKGGRVSAGATR